MNNWRASEYRLALLCIIGCSDSSQVSRDAGALPSSAPVAEADIVEDPRWGTIARGELLVDFQKGVSPDAAYALIESLPAEIRAYDPFFNGYQIRLTGTDTPNALERALEQLRASPNVRAAKVHAAIDVFCADGTPDDTLLAEQWGLEYIQAPAAWDDTTGSTQINSAVIDVGFDVDHPDLRRSLRTATGNVSPALAHGTHVAGIMAAAGNNATGIAGVSWNSALHLLQVPRPAFENDIRDRVREAIINDEARVVNLSMGRSWPRAPAGCDVAVDPNFDDADRLEELQGYVDYWGGVLDALVVEATHEFLIVEAAGNSNVDARWSYNFNSFDGSDSRRSKVITVAASVNNATRPALADFSNHGRTVDVAAPGVDVLSTCPTIESSALSPARPSPNAGCRDECADRTYGECSGTSMAAPFVSGVTHLIWSKYPELTAAEVKAAIVEGANAGGRRAERCGLTYPILNAEQALLVAGETCARRSCEASGERGCGLPPESPSCDAPCPAGQSCFERRCVWTPTAPLLSVDRTSVPAGNSIATTCSLGSSGASHAVTFQVASPSFSILGSYGVSFCQKCIQICNKIENRNT